MNIMFEEEKEQLKIDSDRLKVEKSCSNCKHYMPIKTFMSANCLATGIIFEKFPRHITKENWHCSYYKMKESD